MCPFTIFLSRFITYAPSFILGKLFLEITPLNLGSYLRYLVTSILFKEWNRTKSFYQCILFPLILFTIEEITGCTNEGAKGDNKAPRNPPYCFFISSFTVSVSPSINTPESCNDFMILIISFIFSFENK